MLEGCPATISKGCLPASCHDELNWHRSCFWSARSTETLARPIFSSSRPPSSSTTRCTWWHSAVTHGSLSASACTALISQVDPFWFLTSEGCQKYCHAPPKKAMSTEDAAAPESHTVSAFITCFQMLEGVIRRKKLKNLFWYVCILHTCSRLASFWPCLNASYQRARLDWRPHASYPHLLGHWARSSGPRAHGLFSETIAWSTCLLVCKVLLRFFRMAWAAALDPPDCKYSIVVATRRPSLIAAQGPQAFRHVGIEGEDAHCRF